jgi:Ser/Thr protein kinase RdoA (MazF antagonist)
MFDDKLDFNGDINSVLTAACRAYGVGELVGYDVIKTGYEDCNIKIKTARGRYLCKIFASYRTSAYIARHGLIMQKIMSAGIAHPRLHMAENSYLFLHSGLSILMMDWIDGLTFYEMGRTPDDSELNLICAQAAKINGMKFDNLPSAEDSCEVDNISDLYDDVAPFISDKHEHKIITDIVSDYKNIPFAQLPVSFVHADLIGTNIIKSDKKEIYIIDFGVARMYSRIVELAVIIGRMMIMNGCGLDENTGKVAAAYSKYSKLLDAEIAALPKYARAATASMFLWAYHQKFVKKNNSPETNFWLNMARNSIVG